METSKKTGKVFWYRVMDEYNKATPLRDWSKRTKDQLMSKWTNVNATTKTFNSYYQECVRIRGSGTSDDQLPSTTLSMYSASENNATFKLNREWF